MEEAIKSRNSYLLLIVGKEKTDHVQTTHSNYRQYLEIRPPGMANRRSSIMRKQSVAEARDPIVITPVVFGDALGNHGDYSRGLFYSIRRKYLSAPNGSLRPPVEFLTRQQKRNHVKIEKEGVFLKVQQLDFKKQLPEGESEVPQRVFVQNKKATEAAKTVLVQKYTSIDPADWVEEHQAGVTFYTHKTTGEISSVKPWAEFPFFSRTPYSSAPPSRMVTPRGGQGSNHFEDDEEALGTGHLAYGEGEEVKELLDELELLQAQQAKKRLNNFDH